MFKKSCNVELSSFVTQSSIVKGKQIIDEVLIVNEVVDDITKNNRELIVFNQDSVD